MRSSEQGNQKGPVAMTATTGSAQEIARQYAQAWLAGDAEKALSFIADDVVCQASSGETKGLAAYRQFLTPFATGLVRGELIDVLGDGTHAATVYSVDMPAVKEFRGMEYLTVADGKITHVISVFDRLPMVQASGSQPA